MRELSFEDHIKKLKQLLDIDPCVKQGEEAIELINLYTNAKFMHGGYEHSTDTIAVPKAMRIGTLAHEMRHAWQYKNRIDKGFSFGVKMGKLKAAIIYLTGKKEFDANYFAFHYCWQVGIKKQAIEHLLKALSTWFFRIAFLTIPLYLVWLLYILRPYYTDALPKLRDIIQIIL